MSVNLFTSERDPGKLPEFIKNEGLSFPVLYDRSGRAAEDYGIESIPATVIIDREGRIVDVKTGAVTNVWLKRAVKDR